MNTTNLAELKASPNWALLSPGLQSSIVEKRPVFSTVESQYAPLPPCKMCVERSCVIFEKPITLTELNQVSVVGKSWIFLRGQPGTLSKDGLELTIPAARLVGVNNADKLNGFVNGTFTVNDTLPRFTNPPTDWTRPIILIDPAQLNDTTTYDGAFPSSTTEARALANVTMKGHILWMYYSDFLLLGSKDPVSVPKPIDKTELKRVYVELGKIIESL